MDRRVAPFPGTESLGEFIAGGRAEFDQGVPVVVGDAVTLRPALRRVADDVEPEVLQLAGQAAGAAVFDDLLMASHEHGLAHGVLGVPAQIVIGEAGRTLAASATMKIGDRIAAARKAKGWAQHRLADAIGTGQTTVSSWERGRTEPSRADVARVASALDVDAAYLEVEDGSRPARRTVPLVGYVGAGAVAHFYARADEGLDEVDAPDDAKETTVAAEIRGESLGPAFDRWLVFFDEVRSPVTPDMFGELCVVGLPNEKVLVKILRPAGTEGHFHLISNGVEPTLFDQEVTWAALVTNMKRRR